MEYLKSFIGKKVSGFIRLDHDQDYYSYFQNLGIHIQFFEEGHGISILTDNIGDEIICFSLYQEQFEKEKLDGYGSIYYPKAEDSLNFIIGQELKAIRLGLYSASELEGNGFIIQKGKLQAMIFEFDNKELLIMNSGDQIWIEVDERIKAGKFAIENVELVEIKKKNAL